MSKEISLAILNERQELLSFRNRRFIKLPKIGALKGRIGFELTNAVRELLGTGVYLLEPLRPGQGSLPILRFQSSCAALPTGYGWVHPHEITCGPIPEPDVLDRVWRNRVSVGGYDWYAELSEWLAEQVSRLGYRLLSLDQWNSVSGNVLIRVKTTGPQFWFKAVCDANWRDFSFAQLLSEKQFFPSPHVRAIEPLWKGMLLEHVPGTELLACQNVETFMEAMRLLAELQIRGMGSSQSLLLQGATDLRAATMSRMLPDLLRDFEDALGIMKSDDDDPESMSLKALAPALERMCFEVASLSFCDGLVPASLNPHHVLLTPNGLVLIDWAQACVSLPLIAGESLWLNLGRESLAQARWAIRLRMEYFSCWGRAFGYSAWSSMIHHLPAFSTLAAAIFYRDREAQREGDNFDMRMRLFARQLQSVTRRIFESWL